MTTKEVLELINQLAVYNPLIYFGGAEAFVRALWKELSPLWILHRRF